ncbi:MAG: hypothetical protein KKD38_02295 [Candidatus Delongbacteria bacterium]|nr:hypothetical protein [Candidatus Delongbacteria bacterium]MCG2759643.1 hypothetical protein [Candidatus Delongbacteria bacterium]
MDLIERIKNILSQNGLKSPVFDLHYDNQLNVIGYIADEFFEDKDDKQCQEYIWEKLKSFMGDEDLVRILTIFHETPKERAERMIEYSPISRSKSRFWVHSAPDQAKYWIFLDVARFDDGLYKTFSLIINKKENIKKGLIFEYNQEVIGFMELEQGEIYQELFDNTFRNAESELKYFIMQKHEKLTEKGLWGSDNMYDYIYKNNFRLTSVTKNQLIFTEDEIPVIESAIQHLDDFEIKKEIELAIKKSQIINGSKKNI